MISTTQLDNGIRVISHRLPQMHTVSIGIWVASGARHEPPELNGIAHFIEHLLFKGTGRRSARQISLEIDSMGGVLNAFTGHEYVCYYAKVLASCLPRAADLLADIFLHSAFPADEIERERKVVLQEIRMRDDDPEQFIHDRFHQNFWRGTSLGLPILGSDETVGALTRDAIIAYQQSRYRPHDIIISAAGNVNHQELVDIFSASFSTMLPARVPTHNDSGVRSADSRQVNLTERDLEQTLICLGTDGLSQDAPDRYALYLLSTILGGGMSSRLFQEVREKRGLAYSVYSYVASHADGGSLVVYAGTERQHCLEVIDIARLEMSRLKNELVPVDELGSAREQLKGKILMSLESTDSLMTRIAKNEIYLHRNQSIEEVLSCFDAVTSDDILRLAGRLFDGSRFNLEIMGRTGGLELTAEQIIF